jgi:hypothetical protein
VVYATVLATVVHIAELFRQQGYEKVKVGELPDA